MNVVDVQVAGELELGQRAGQLGVGDGEAVHAQVAAVKQADDFGNRGALQAKAHAELVFAVRAGVQQTARGELAEGLDPRSVRAGAPEKRMTTSPFSFG